MSKGLYNRNKDIIHQENCVADISTASTNKNSKTSMAETSLGP